MSLVNFKISIPSDNKNYFRLSCPYCKHNFKLNSDEFNENDKPNLYCPACGLTNEIQTFYTSQIYEKAEAIAMNYVEEQLSNILKQLGKKNSKSFKVTSKFKPNNYEPEIYEIDDNLIIINNSCCNKNSKVWIYVKFLDTFCLSFSLGQHPEWIVPHPK